MKRGLLAICVSLIFAFSFAKDYLTPADYVNPTIDSHKSRWFFFASASRPFGMVSLSPDTWVKGSWNSGYLYDSNYVRCFSHIHAWQMSGVPVMPSVGKFEGHKGFEATKSSFSHFDEKIRPGFHKLKLDRYDIEVELTSTSRVGFHKYKFPKTDSAYIAFHTGAFLAHGETDMSYIKQISPYEIEGYSLMGKTRRRSKPTYVYFVARFDHPMEEFNGWEDGKIFENNPKEIIGKNNGAFMRFKTDKDAVMMKVAVSYTSINNARNNLETELFTWDFLQTVYDSENEWNELLSRIKVYGGSLKQRIKFYTDLWHSLQGRHIVSDVNGDYCDMTGEKPVIRRVRVDTSGIPLYPQYNFDALWGAHWTINVLWSSVYPDIMEGFCNSMINMYKDGGLIPRGPSGGNYTYVMIGDPASSFFATAYHKGIKDYDTLAMYKGLLHNASPGGIRDRAGYEHGPRPKGGGMNYYASQGYVPEGISGSCYHRNGASMTLEYAYQDWCVAQLSKSFGKIGDYQHFMIRSENYKKLWNPKSGLIHPKEKDGSWISDFSPIAKGFTAKGFTESNSAIYTNFVPHDMKGLADLFGGNDKYEKFLTESFMKSSPNQFVADHGQHAKSWVDYENQPSCQMAHIFNHIGYPWLSQKWVREVKERTFGQSDAYGGYNGDEDQGQMGALGVLMAIGLFQMDGGASAESQYDLTSPIFNRVILDLHDDYYNGNTLTIYCENNSARNMYIQSARFNNTFLENRYFLTKDEFSKGGRLFLKMGSEPNKSWGVEEQ